MELANLDMQKAMLIEDSKILKEPENTFE